MKAPTSALLLPFLLAACSPEGAGSAPSASAATLSSAKPASSAAAPSASAPAQPASTAARTSGSAQARDGKVVKFSLALPDGFSDRTPSELGKFQRVYAVSEDLKEGYVFEVSGPNPLLKDAATLVAMVEKQGAKVLRNESADGGFVVALEPKEGGGKLLLLHASVDKGRVYCRGNAGGSVTADAAKAVELMVNVCKTARAEE